MNSFEFDCVVNLDKQQCVPCSPCVKSGNLCMHVAAIKAGEKPPRGLRQDSASTPCVGVPSKTVITFARLRRFCVHELYECEPDKFGKKV